jgi:hypothetical protein
MKKILLGVAILISSMGVANANVVQNGSFEENRMASGNWGFVNVTDWTNSDSVGTELRHNVAGVASSGFNFVELDGNQNSSISQTLNTIEGQKYTFSFDYANRYGVSVASNGLDWSLGNDAGSAPVINSGNGWHTFSQDFTATSSQTLLKFTAIGTNDSLGSSLDNISVSPVPEPEEWAMMMLGLGLMGFVSKRKNPDNVIAL